MITILSVLIVSMFSYLTIVTYKALSVKDPYVKDDCIDGCDACDLELKENKKLLIDSRERWYKELDSSYSQSREIAQKEIIKIEKELLYKLPRAGSGKK